MRQLNADRAAGPGDDLPEVPGEGAGEAVRLGRGAGGGPAAVPGGRADPGPAGRGVGAGLAVGRRKPALAGSLGAMALLLIAIAAISTISAGRLKVERDAVLKNLHRAQIAEADSQDKLFDSLKAQAQAGRFSRRVGQRFDSLDALAQAAQIGRERKMQPERVRRAPR